jgi:5'(3')-deoxyribonucleotidase
VQTKRIGIDVDDVLADFVSAFRAICNKLYGTPLDTEPVDWAWSNFNLTKEQLDKAWEVVRSTSQFWYLLHPVDSASYFSMQRLRNKKLFFITSRFDTRGASAEDQTAAWLAHNYDLMYPTAIVGTPKGITAKALGLTHFVDDRPENCLDVLAHVPECQVFIKDTSHNRHFKHPGISRVTSFDAFSLLVGGQN